MSALNWTKHLLEYLAGEQDEAPPGFPITLYSWWFWGTWWAVFSALILMFSGQTAKFIYIDF